KTSRWIQVVARVGFIAKGVIYFSIGLLAFQIVVGMGGKTAGSTQILKNFSHQPFGRILLIFCIVGLLAHTAWRFVNGWYEIEYLVSCISSLFFRAVEIIVGFIYLSLAYAAYQILTGKGAQGSGESSKIWFSKILTIPGGNGIIMTIGVVIFIIGI